MAHRFSLSLMFTLATLLTWGVPARQQPFTVTNSDGTTLTLMLYGDECGHFYATPDGIPAVSDSKGDWHLAPQLADSLRHAWSRRSAQLNRQRRTRAASQEWQNSLQGKRKGIVLLVNFKDKKMKSHHTNARFREMFNKTGYDGDGCTGSVHDYFYDQSYGAFDLTFDVFGPIELSMPADYYGANDQNGDDKHIAPLVDEACRKADRMNQINWGDYDWNGDGAVDQVFIVHAGNGEHSGADPNTIWAHESSLSFLKLFGDGDGAISLGGHAIDTYAISCELRGASPGSTALDGIGTACHEFSHCLGLPDFYDVDYGGGFGMSNWDVMAAGNTNGLSGWGESPAGFTAWERAYVGWLNLTELNAPATIENLPSIDEKPVAYVLRSPVNPDEFFILENRQSNRWFRYVGIHTNAHGLLITHVDFDQQEWDSNNVNTDPKHQRMCIVPAAGVYGTLRNSGGTKMYITSGDQFRSQLFPGSHSITAFTPQSHASCGGTLFTPAADGTSHLGMSVCNISEKDGLISFSIIHDDPTSIQTISHDTPHEYYTTNGVRIDNPDTPGIYILRSGATNRKIYHNGH